MTKEEIYKASDVLNTILDNYLHGGEAAEVVTKFEDELIKSIFTKEEPVSNVVDDSDISCDAELCAIHTSCKYFNLNKKCNVNHCIGGLPLQLKQKKEEPVSEDLEAEIKDYDKSVNPQGDLETLHNVARYFAQWGARWQREHMMANAFTFTKEHDTACILASECLRNHGWFNRERDFNGLWRHLSCVDELFEGKFSGKTKVIVIKED